MPHALSRYRNGELDIAPSPAYSGNLDLQFGRYESLRQLLVPYYNLLAAFWHLL